MSATPREIMEATIGGRRAAEHQLPHTTNPHAWHHNYELYLVWFNAWHVRRVELEDGIKLQVNAPNQSELL